MGDATILPNGPVLFINGAQLGTTERHQIARMYHSTLVLLPNGKIWIAGSNTHEL
jgi:hypothetical protein